jgi:hypothetical protein
LLSTAEFKIIITSVIQSWLAVFNSHKLLINHSSDDIVTTFFLGLLFLATIHFQIQAQIISKYLDINKEFGENTG